VINAHALEQPFLRFGFVVAYVYVGRQHAGVLCDISPFLTLEARFVVARIPLGVVLFVCWVPDGMEYMRLVVEKQTDLDSSAGAAWS